MTVCRWASAKTGAKNKAGSSRHGLQQGQREERLFGMEMYLCHIMELCSVLLLVRGLPLLFLFYFLFYGKLPPTSRDNCILYIHVRVYRELG